MEFLGFLCKKNPKICKMFWKNHQTFQTTKLLKKILIIFKKQTTGIDVSKEEMKSTNKMLKVLGKRLYQVWGAFKYKEKI